MPHDVDATEAWRRASAVGPFFEISEDVESVTWQPFSLLLAPEPDRLLARVAQTRAALAQFSDIATDQVELRVAGSLWFQGWAARLVSPWMGAAVLGDVVPVASPDQLLWAAVRGQPVPLAVRRPRGQPLTSSDASDVAQSVYDACIDPLVAPLLEAVAEACSVSRRVLLGNVASSVAGAAAQLVRAAPSYATVTRAVGERLLTTGVLAGQGDDSGGRFVRRTCCLMYRLPEAGLCGDCVLAHR